MNEIIWYLSFSDWLISLSMMPSRSIHAVTKFKIYAHLSMLIAALFTVAKIWKQPKCPSEDAWIKKLWCIPLGVLSCILEMGSLSPSLYSMWGTDFVLFLVLFVWLNIFLKFFREEYITVILV